MLELRVRSYGVLGQRFEKIYQPKTEVLVSLIHGAAAIPRWMSIVFVPIAHDPMLGECDELRIRLNELFEHRRVETAQIVVDDLKYLDHIFADELDNERGNPNVGRTNDALKKRLASVARVMSGEEAVNQLSLQVG